MPESQHLIPSFQKRQSFPVALFGQPPLLLPVLRPPLPVLHLLLLVPVPPLPVLLLLCYPLLSSESFSVLILHLQMKERRLPALALSVPVSMLRLPAQMRSVLPAHSVVSMPMLLFSVQERMPLPAPVFLHFQALFVLPDKPAVLFHFQALPPQEHLWLPELYLHHLYIPENLMHFLPSLLYLLLPSVLPALSHSQTALLQKRLSFYLRFPVLVLLQLLQFLPVSLPHHTLA